jgi:hypothetical protein
MNVERGMRQRVSRIDRASCTSIAAPPATVAGGATVVSGAMETISRTSATMTGRRRQLALYGHWSCNNRDVIAELTEATHGEATYRELTVNHRELLRIWRNRGRREAARTC